MFIINVVNKLTKPFGYGLVRQDAGFSEQELEIIERVTPFTMTGPARLAGVIDAVQYLVASQIPGDIVECGVWRGGSMMAAALMLKKLGDTSRKLYLFDTYEGMPPPSGADLAYNGRTAREILDQTPRKEGPGVWAIASLEDVRRNVIGTGYPQENLHFVKGKVEHTLPQNAPASISLLRLDTDWYESTRHELLHLYPRLSKSGVLIIDDYGHWQGSRKAVDEYFAKQTRRPFLNRLDYTGRLAVKLAD